MEYEKGCLIQVGDIVTIDGKYSGQVVASMATATYLPAELGSGLTSGHELDWMHLTKAEPVSDCQT